MVYHDCDTFLTQLTTLLKQSQTNQSGSVHFTYKRYTPHADESVRLLQRTSLAHKPKHKHTKQRTSYANDNNTQHQSSHHPANHVSVDTEPVLLIHCKYKHTKLVTTVAEKQMKSFIKSLNAIMTVHNALLEANEPVPPRARPTPPNKQKRAVGTDTDTATDGETTQSSKQKQPSKKQKPSKQPVHNDTAKSVT